MDSQESSPASQFENINSSALRLFYGSNPYVDPYVNTGKTIALTTWTFVGKVMSLLFNTLSRFVIALLPRSKCLSFKAAVTIHSDFGAQENNVCHYFHFFPTYLPLSDGIECRDLSFVECWVLSQLFHSTLSYIYMCAYTYAHIYKHTHIHIYICVYIYLCENNALNCHSIYVSPVYIFLPRRNVCVFIFIRIELCPYIL